MIQGTTKSGFKYKINDKMLDDYEIVELLGELEDNPLVMPKLIKRILGDDQVVKLKDHLKDKDGFISTVAMTQELESIFQNQTLKK